MRALRKLLLLLPLVAAGACAAKPGLDDAKAVFAQSGLASLADAACHGDVHAIDQLLQDGAPVDGEGKRSTTPLAWAVGCRDVEGVRRLLEAGADPNHLIDGKYTVFWAAVAHDNVDILRAMVAHGADIDFMAPDEATPLMHAVTVGAWHSYDYLIEAGADLNKAGPVNWRNSSARAYCSFSFRQDHRTYRQRISL